MRAGGRDLEQERRRLGLQLLALVLAAMVVLVLVVVLGPSAEPVRIDRAPAVSPADEINRHRAESHRLRLCDSGRLHVSAVVCPPAAGA